MGQKLGSFWGRAEGKQHVRKICDKIFDQCIEGNESGLLGFNDLHCATLLVYNEINKSFPGPHKEPPSAEIVRNMVELLGAQKLEGLDRERFYLLILDWIYKELRLFAVNKFFLALLAAPAMAEATKNSGKKVPWVEKVIEKIPTPIFISAYTVALVLLQDFSLSVY
ncbi:uncharacterized protein LOC131247901 isoform X2 [Magnolia sinica]|uniref:uncharacterized protein LOC131247901 isoform X2 n=1 Tax=Magnolia sinica TaxID=86752 RepID=UPI0026584552|nr:uncharacterized protein LOC131247901 isoform X2 [Magnolia sinica]